MVVCPLAFNASSYMGKALSNSFLLQGISDTLRLMAFGRCFIMLGGWLDFVLMYCG